MSMVQVGQVVVRKPATITGLDGKKTQRMRGAVVWIHPKERFHVVSFQTNGGPVRECFMGVKVDADPDYRD